MKKKLYKIIIQEQMSCTSYVFAYDEEEAKTKAIYDDVHCKSNKDFEQNIIKINEVEKKDFPKNSLTFL